MYANSLPSCLTPIARVVWRDLLLIGALCRSKATARLFISQTRADLQPIHCSGSDLENSKVPLFYLLNASGTTFIFQLDICLINQLQIFSMTPTPD